MTNIDNLIRNGELSEEMTAAVYAHESAVPKLMEHRYLANQVNVCCEVSKKLGYCVPKENIFAEQA